MKLKIKNEFLNSKTTIGKNILDTNNVKEEHFQYYYDNGFDYCFEEIKKAKKVKEIVKKELNSLKNAVKEVKKYTKDEKTNK